MFFDDFQSLGRIAVVGVCAYVILVVFLRISGRRTLSKMNAFDFVVTVALGSTLATVLLNTDVALAEGATAFVLLIALQFIVTWTSVRVPLVKKIVTGEPIMLLYKGEFLPAALLKARVTKNEVLAAIRSNGAASHESIEAVVLETDGSFSVIQADNGGTRSSLDGVKKLGA